MFVFAKLITGTTLLMVQGNSINDRLLSSLVNREVFLGMHEDFEYIQTIMWSVVSTPRIRHVESQQDSSISARHRLGD